MGAPRERPCGSHLWRRVLPTARRPDPPHLFPDPLTPSAHCKTRGGQSLRGTGPLAGDTASRPTGPRGLVCSAGHLPTFSLRHLPSNRPGHWKGAMLTVFQVHTPPAAAGDPEAACEGPSAAPGPPGLHLLEGFPGKQRPGALEMNLLSLLFSPSSFKGSQT